MPNSTLDEKETRIQKGLGTLPMKSFTITQPLTLTFELDVVQEIETQTKEEALKQFKDDLDDPEVLIENVENQLRHMVDKYNSYSNRDNLRVPRAIAEARAGMKEEEILVLRVREIEKEN